MNELDSKIARLDAAQSDIPLDELRSICTFIEKNRGSFPKDASFYRIPSSAVSSQFPVRVNNINGEIDIFLDREKPFGEGQLRISMRSLQYDREEVVLLKILETKMDSSIERFIQEIDHLQTLGGEPGIPAVFDFIQTKKGAYDYLELCEQFYNRGNLLNYREACEPGRKQTLSILKQILTDVANLHSKGYLLQDFSPKNCLIHEENDKILVGIGDLEMLTPVAEIHSGAFEWHADLAYAPPEFWKAEFEIQDFFDIPSRFRQNIDMWGVGCCFWALLSETPLPWEGLEFPTPEDMLDLVTLDIEEPEDVSSLEHLTWEMMREDPSERTDSQEALKKLNIKYNI